MTPSKIQINRAPVLTLWAVVVAERLGFNHGEALSLGKALAGLNAQSKGRRLGIFKPTPKELKKVRERERGEEFRVDLLGRALPAVNTDEGVRAVVKSKPIEPETVERYLESKFGEALPEVRKVLMELANAFDPDELAQQGFSLYEQFRPQIPEGVSGWGAKGELDLGRIRKLGLPQRGDKSRADGKGRSLFLTSAAHCLEGEPQVFKVERLAEDIVDARQCGSLCRQGLSVGFGNDRMPPRGWKWFPSRSATTYSSPPIDRR